MHVADRRHGLDVVAGLRRSGVTRPRRAGGRACCTTARRANTGVGPRVAWSLGEAFGPWVSARRASCPGWGAALDRLRDHAEASAALVEAAGLPPFAVDLVRYQAEPRDPEYGRLFQLADEAA